MYKHRTAWSGVYIRNGSQGSNPPKNPADCSSQIDNPSITCARRPSSRSGGTMGGVGREIRRLREARGWGQTKLAAAADMAVSGVSQIENGHRNPNSATLIKLARALDVDVADLFPKGQARLPLDDAL